MVTVTKKTRIKNAKTINYILFIATAITAIDAYNLCNDLCPTIYYQTMRDYNNSPITTNSSGTDIISTMSVVVCSTLGADHQPKTAKLWCNVSAGYCRMAG